MPPFRPGLADGLAVTHLFIGRAPDVRRPPPYGSALVPVGTVAPAASRACVVNAARLHSHEAGTCSTASPSTRRRVCRYRPTRLASAPGVVAPFPPRSGANGSRRYPGNPNQWQVDCVLLISCHLVGVNRNSRPAKRPAKRGLRGACHRSSTCSTTSTAVVRPNRASGARGSGSRLSTVPVGSPSGSRPYEALDSISSSSPLSCASSSSETSIRSVDSPARKRRRAARRRAYRARAVNNASSVPRLSRDCPRLRFPPESLHRRREPTPSVRVLLPVQILSRSFRRILLAGLQDAFQSGKWPLCCLAATAYRISTASGETERHRHVRTAGRRRSTGHLVDLEEIPRPFSRTADTALD